MFRIFGKLPLKNVHTTSEPIFLEAFAQFQNSFCVSAIVRSICDKDLDMSESWNIEQSLVVTKHKATFLFMANL